MRTKKSRPFCVAFFFVASHHHPHLVYSVCPYVRCVFEFAFFLYSSFSIWYIVRLCIHDYRPLFLLTFSLTVCLSYSSFIWCWCLMVCIVDAPYQPRKSRFFSFVFFFTALHSPLLCYCIFHFTLNYSSFHSSPHPSVVVFVVVVFVVFFLEKKKKQSSKPYPSCHHVGLAACVLK